MPSHQLRLFQMPEHPTPPHRGFREAGPEPANSAPSSSSLCHLQVGICQPLLNSHNGFPTLSIKFHVSPSWTIMWATVPSSNSSRVPYPVILHGNGHRIFWNTCLDRLFTFIFPTWKILTVTLQSALVFWSENSFYLPSFSLKWWVLPRGGFSAFVFEK